MSDSCNPTDCSLPRSSVHGITDKTDRPELSLDHLGLSPCTAVPNMPVTIETYTGDAWQPKEAGKVVYDGALKPLWWGLAQSRNNYSAWIMKQARQPGAVADFIHKMGIRSYVDPVFAMCLGTSDFSLYEMVGAYTTYANKGVYS